MAEWLEIEPGVFIDPETGEIAEGSDTMENTEVAWAAARYYGAQEQRKGWERAEQALKQRLLRLTAGEKRTVAGEYLVSRRQAARKVQDVQGFLDWMSGAELHPAEWKAAALASKGFDPAALKGSFLGEQLDARTTEVLNAPYVIVEPIKKPAPRVRDVVE